MCLSILRTSVIAAEAVVRRSPSVSRKNATLRAHAMRRGVCVNEGGIRVGRKYNQARVYDSHSHALGGVMLLSALARGTVLPASTVVQLLVVVFSRPKPITRVFE